MISVAHENIANALPDLHALFPAQWKETGDTEFPFDPNWSNYSKLEEFGNLALFVMRENPRAIGYALGTTYPHPNSQKQLVGAVPTWFVEPRDSRALLERSLLQHVITYFCRRHVHRIVIETTYSRSAGRLLEAMRFKPMKIGYCLKVNQAEARCA